MTKTAAVLLAIGGLCLTLFACTALYFASKANELDKDRMQACVSNGGEWRRDMGSYYECVR